MPQLALVAGIGATGTAMAQFFHPSTKIREKWPQNNKRSLGYVGDWQGHPEGPAQKPDVLRIPKINDSTIFLIVKKNFKVLFAPAIPFKSKVPSMHNNSLPAPVIPGEALNPDRIADRDVVVNIKGFSTYHIELCGDVTEKKRQGMTVNDDNDPLPENATPPGQVLPSKSMIWGRTTPRACCQ